MSLIFRGLLALALSISTALAFSPQDPDPSFGVNGTLALPFFISGPPNETQYALDAVAQMADDRIAIVGRKIVGPVGNRQTRPVIAVVGEFGESINQGFIFDSEWNPSFTPSGERGWLNALQTLPNGDVLYCGGHTGPGGLGNGHRAVVGRLKGDLMPDYGFGEDGGQGWQRIALGLGDVECQAIEQLAGGRILIGGSYVDQNLGQNEFNKGTFLAMLTPDGQLDPSFAGNGLLIRFRGLGSLPTAQFTISSLRHGRGFSGAPDQRPVIAVERNMDNPWDTRAFSVMPNGELPFGETTFNAFDAVASRGLKALRLPNGALQSAQSRGWNVLTVKRHASSMLGHGDGMDWTSELNLHPLSVSVGGMALDLDGQSLVVLQARDPESTTAGDRIHLVRVNHAGGLSFNHQVGSGLSVPPGQVEVLDVADAIIQSNRRYLVLFNRLLQQDGTTISPERAYLRRFMGGSGGGASWSLNLLPTGLSFAAAEGAPGEWVVSETRVVGGLSAGISVPAYVAGGEISIDNGPWLSEPVELTLGQLVRLRARAPLQTGDTRTVRLRAGGIRAQNSWNLYADSLAVTDFVVQAGEAVLPGSRCSEGPLNTNCSGAIPDGSGNLESTINLIGSCPFIADVRVGVDISHPRVGDLRLVLKDPNGQVFIGGSVGFVTLLDQPQSGQGGTACQAANVLARFEDQAGLAAQDACESLPGGPGIAGTLRPSQSLGSLAGRFGTGSDGAAGNGLWTLIVRDMVSGQSGTLNDWSLDVTCANSTPNLSDLVVTAVGDGQAYVNEPFSMSFVVTNQGPATASFGRFQSEFPSQNAAGIWFPNWSCSASAGSSCVLPPGGCPGGCQTPDVDLGLNLLPGGSATITMTGTVGPLATPGATLAFNGLAFIPPNVAGNIDPDSSNNQYLLARTIQARADLEALALSASVISAGSIQIEASWRNNGPSPAGDFSSVLNLPAGYTVTSWSCNRGGVSCGTGELSPNQRVLTIAGQSASLNQTSTLLVEAAFSQPQPTGNVSLQLQHASSPHVSDPQLSNNSRTATIPIGALEDQIFRDRFQ